MVATTYFMDLVPLNLRGAFGSVQATGECVGILAAQILGLPQILGGTKTWPYLLGVSAIPCILQFITLPFYPESPHYLFVIQDDKQAAINGKALVALSQNLDCTSYCLHLQLFVNCGDFLILAWNCSTCRTKDEGDKTKSL